MNRQDYLRCLIGALISVRVSMSSAAEESPRFVRRMKELEQKSDGRLGVAVFDSATGLSLDWRGKERFPMCSTFKFLLAAAVLHQIDEGQLTLKTPVAVPAKGLVSYSPVTEKFAGREMAVSDLCESTLIWSDNTAANLLLPLVGGPEGLTKYIRHLGDSITRLDRMEPELNSAIPGDPRDTTTPFSMLRCMRVLLLDEALKEESKLQLTRWLLDNRTGDQRLRAGLPVDAKVGDKTGTGKQTTNDIAVVWPKNRKPVLIACFLTESSLESEAREGIQAAVAREVSSLWET